MGRVQYGSKKKLDRTKQNSAERKTKNQATFGNNCFLIQIHLWHEKKNAEQKVTENWAPIVPYVISGSCKTLHLHLEINSFFAFAMTHPC